jgi:hypothetical protein
MTDKIITTALLSFILGMVVAPYRDPIYFITILLISQVFYLIVLGSSNISYIMISIFTYIIGWVFGRKLFSCYDNNLFARRTRPWQEQDTPDEMDLLGQFAYMSRHIDSLTDRII